MQMMTLSTTALTPTHGDNVVDDQGANKNIDNEPLGEISEDK